MTNPEKKYITQDPYSVTYNPSFLSFLPTKRGYRNKIKFSNTPQHHNIIQQNLSTTLNLVALTDSGHFFPNSANMTTENQTTLASPIQHVNTINFKNFNNKTHVLLSCLWVSLDDFLYKTQTKQMCHIIARKVNNHMIWISTNNKCLKPGNFLKIQ